MCSVGVQPSSPRDRAVLVWQGGVHVIRVIASKGHLSPRASWNVRSNIDNFPRRNTTQRVLCALLGAHKMNLSRNETPCEMLMILENYCSAVVPIRFRRLGFFWFPSDLEMTVRCKIVFRLALFWDVCIPEDTNCYTSHTASGDFQPFRMLTFVLRTLRTV